MDINQKDYTYVSIFSKFDWFIKVKGAATAILLGTLDAAMQQRRTPIPDYPDENRCVTLTKAALPLAENNTIR